MVIKYISSPRRNLKIEKPRQILQTGILVSFGMLSRLIPVTSF
jgi:hypothetical protein